MANDLESTNHIKPTGIIDVHAHILPGIDDGARTMDESVCLILSAIEQGVVAMIATPHYSRRKELSGLGELAEELRKRIWQVCPGFSVFLGQETYYHEELPRRLKEGKALTMAGSRYVLVEFDPGASWQTMFRGLRKLMETGYTPILAHMERYVCLRQENRVRELISCGCRMQMNYESLAGRWYQSEPRWCRRQILEGRIHLLGSDMHRVDFRPPKITPAYRWLEAHVESGYVDRLTRGNPEHILKNERME